MSQNTIPCQSILSIEQRGKIRNLIDQNPRIHHAVEYLSDEFELQITSDPDVVKGFERDYSNLQKKSANPEHCLEEKHCFLVFRIWITARYLANLQLHLRLFDHIKASGDIHQLPNQTEIVFLYDPYNSGS